MERVDVPAAWVSGSDHVRLELCARHGEPTEDERAVEFHPKLPAWAWIAIPSFGVALGVAIKALGIAVAPVALVVLAIDQKIRPRMKVAAWPYCARCIALGRRRRLGVAVSTLGVITAFLSVLRLAMGTIDGLALALLLVACLVMVTGVLLREKYAWRRIAGGHASKDRRSVQVKAHARFAAAVRDRFTADQEVAAPQSTNR